MAAAVGRRVRGQPVAARAALARAAPRPPPRAPPRQPVDQAAGEHNYDFYNLLTLTYYLFVVIDEVLVIAHLK